jgi:predicted nucleotide-binding protein (sugar kinase/HSP70/actin superfamily)
MGPGAEIIAAALCGEGLRAEALPLPTRQSLRLGRRYTSGKECVPMTITAGSLLERLEAETSPEEQFAFLMPSAGGPCRFGTYNLLHKILLEKTGWRDRVEVVSPDSSNYFADVSADFQIRACVAMMAADLLLDALHDVRPAERVPGAARDIYDRYFAELAASFRAIGPGNLARGLTEISSGAFGVRKLLERAAAEFRRAKDFSRDLPAVSVVGEIYVRLDPFANDFLVEKLEARGIRAVMAPFSEWLEYMTHLQLQRIDEGRPLAGDHWMNAQIVRGLQNMVTNRLRRVMADALGWGPRTTVDDTLQAATPYVNPELFGEAVLTLGGPLHEHLHGAIDGVVAVGPHECMPNKVAEAQLAHVGEDHGLISLALPVNGDPIDPELLDRFAFEIKERHAARADRPRAPAVAGNGTRRRPSMTDLLEMVPGFGANGFVPLAGLRRRPRGPRPHPDT